MTIGSLSPFHAWRIVALLALVAALNYLDRMMITTMRQSLVAAIPMTNAQFGLLTSLFLWTYAFMSPLGGFLADRINRSIVIIASLFVWSIVTWMTAHATTFNALLVTRVLMGLSEACYMPAALALIADYHRGPTRSLAMGFHSIGVSVGSGLGGLGGWLAESHDWSYAFSLFGIIGAAYSVALIFFLRDVPIAPGVKTTPVRFLEATRYLFSIPSYYLALAYWGFLAIASWAISGWLPTFLAERFSLGQGAAGLSATGYLPPAVWLGALVGGLWSDRWSRNHVKGRIYVSMVGLLTAAPFVFVALYAQSFGIAIGAFMLFSFGTTFSNINMMPILCLFTKERYRATGFGILNCLSCVIGGLSIYAGGVVRDSDLDVGVVFGFGAAITIVCAVLITFIRPTEPAFAADK